MAGPSTRMLELLSRLQAQRFWHGPELAARLGVAPRTVRRDRDRLRGHGYLIDAVPGPDGGYQLASGSSLPPMVFSDEEAVALAVGLQSVAHGVDAVTAEASLRALAKLTALLPPVVQQRVALLQEVTDAVSVVADQAPARTSAQVLGIVAQACADGVRLRFGYASDDLPDRYVEPYRLVTRARRWYLVAYDLDRGDWRTFRVDRMTHPSATRNQFPPRALPADDLQQYLADRISDLQPQFDVVFDIALTPDVCSERFGPAATVSTVSAGLSRVAVTVSRIDWALYMLVQIGVPFDAVSTNLAAVVEHWRRQLG